ncbi:MAG: helix-turn-helix domain-containing protein [Planctomycetes bacterium]|jgi:AraC-like DNA-binding protein|nr:helix-turn-helix domain-containing protein [Planctomycetota bacterium]
MDFSILLLYYVLMFDKGLTFLHGGRRPNCAWYIDKRLQGYWVMQYTTAGDVKLAYDGRRHVLSDPAFWFFWPHLPIRVEPGASGKWNHRYIAFNGKLASRWDADGLIVRQPQVLPDGKNLTDRFDRMLAMAFRPDKWRPLRARNLLESILLELAEMRCPTLQNRPDWLVKTCTALERTHGGGPDYASIAEACGMAASTFRRKFRQATGLSPHRYHLRARTGAASDLLLDTDLPIKEIARRLGYRDVYFFSRQFKAQTGLSPSSFRQSRQSREVNPSDGGNNAARAGT